VILRNKFYTVTCPTFQPSLSLQAKNSPADCTNTHSFQLRSHISNEPEIPAGDFEFEKNYTNQKVVNSTQRLFSCEENNV